MWKRIYHSLLMRKAAGDFKHRDYLDAYAQHTDARAKIDPEMAIGGLWEEMGRHQFEYLVKHGLSPKHRLLDIGCGSLRGGLWFIDYLEAGNYWGFDISPGVIEAGKVKVRQRGLEDKRPNVFLNKEKNLKFGDLESRDFDFLLAQSVFSHLKPEHIEECFMHVKNVMHQDSSFFFTFHPGETYRQRSLVDFEYPPRFFADLAEKHGYQASKFTEDYAHPRGQGMMRIKLL